MAPLMEGEVDNCSDFEGERCHQILNSCPPCNTMWRLTTESSGQVIIEYKWGNKNLLCKTLYILKALNHDIVLMATKRQKKVSPYPCHGTFLICAIAVISASHTTRFKSSKFAPPQYDMEGKGVILPMSCGVSTDQNV